MKWLFGTMSCVRIIRASRPPMRKKQMAKPPYSMPIFLWSTVVSHATSPVLAVGRLKIVMGLAGWAASLPMKSDLASASAINKVSWRWGAYFRLCR